MPDWPDVPPHHAPGLREHRGNSGSQKQKPLEIYWASRFHVGERGELIRVISCRQHLAEADVPHNVSKKILHSCQYTEPVKAASGPSTVLSPSLGKRMQQCVLLTVTVSPAGLRFPQCYVQQRWGFRESSCAQPTRLVERGGGQSLTALEKRKWSVQFILN